MALHQNRLHQSIQVQDKVISSDAPPYVIAEMACAHDGELNKAKAIVDVAVRAGADAIQFEILDPDDNIVPHTDMYKLLQSLYFTPEQWGELFEYTRQYDIAISSYAYDCASLKVALDLKTDILKLNSSDLSNPDAIVLCAESGLPCTIGTGASSMEEIAESIELYLDHGGKDLVLMHGVQNFPTDLQYLHIRRVDLLRSAFDCLVGYADHTEGGTFLSGVIDLVAIGVGAVIIEKHITLDRSEKGIDYQSALEPDEFKKFVSLMRDARIAFGGSRIQPLNNSDRKYRQFQKKSIVAACSIPEGSKITRDKVAFLRDEIAPGLSPMKVSELLGKTARRSINKFERIHLTDVV
jgi:sialic acid synthase SpsE